MAIPHNLEKVSKDDVKYAVDYKGLRNGFSAPQKFVLKLTSKTNFSHRFDTQECVVTSADEPELPVSVWEGFIDNIGWTTPKVVLTGGEPLLYPDFESLLDMLGENNCRTEIITDGYLLNDYMDSILADHTELTVCFAGDEKSHNKILGVDDSFQRSISALGGLKKAGYEKITLHYTFLPDNVSDAVAFIERTKSLSPVKMVFQHPQFSSPLLNNLMQACWDKEYSAGFDERHIPTATSIKAAEFSEKVADVVAEIKACYASDFNIVFTPDISVSDIKRYYSEQEHFLILPKRVCLKPWQFPTIESNGDVSLCLGYAAGNIQAEGFWDAWGGDKSDNFRKKLMTVERFPICTRCSSLYQDVETA
ncbi:radical SAM protein [Exilibacterium tricleocarpae]|uniref:Radical SAM protein n=1 Tax=Exilibacterium tricleocarpae TaxID=2591008 RepID=A0A545TS88_9GAMM|nr:radical SAM protein [Exilibacterium tricleocarpae]TQV80085.1 radical SAM protein [Exilibacterium tricleocarpae]